MPIATDSTFFRCRSSLPRKNALIVPPSAQLTNDRVREYLEAQGQPLVSPTSPSTSFTFDYVDAPLPAEKLIDGATLSNGIYTYLVRDAVLTAFTQPFYADLSLCLAFSNPAQIDTLAAIRIGETLDITFDIELERATHVTKYHFPSGVPNSGYGGYPFHVEVIGLNTKGFRIVSSFEPQGPTTTSRLPFFMGFRTFGALPLQSPVPVWRDLLAKAVMEALLHRWDHALLFAAFSLEALIDRVLGERLLAVGLGEEYRDHILKVAERSYEIRALAQMGTRYSKRDANKQYERLNQNIFTPRNKLAHGSLRAASITEAMATEAIRIVVEFVWDWDESSRRLLLIETPMNDIASLIDERLTLAC